MAQKLSWGTIAVNGITTGIAVVIATLALEEIRGRR